MANLPPNLTDFNITLSDLSPAITLMLANNPTLSITGQLNNESKPQDIYGLFE